MKDRVRHMTRLTGYEGDTLGTDDVVLHGRSRRGQTDTAAVKQLFLQPDVGSLLHVTAWQIKIVPPAHVHVALISRTSSTTTSEQAFRLV